MKTQEIDNYIVQIKDYKRAVSDLETDQSTSERKGQLEKSLNTSVQTTILKLIHMIEKMQEKGLWLMYKNMEKKERKNTGLTTATQHYQIKKKNNQLN